MGAIEYIRDKVITPLRVQTRVGRAPGCELTVGHSLASSVHALIEWRPPGQWEVRDLASRNGTFVDGAPLSGGEWRVLELNCRLAFGMLDEEWRVTDLDRPPVEARCLVTDERRVASDGILCLSEAPEPWVEVVEDAPGSWVVEYDGDCDVARDGQEIMVGVRRWRLTLPVGTPPTRSLSTMTGSEDSSETRLEFHISADLEHVELIIEYGPQRESTSRAYARGLLELARARLADQVGAGVHVHEHGWIYADDLCALAGYESESRLNVEVHRARRDFARMGLPNPSGLIQRRRGTRQLRIGTAALFIVDGSC